MNTYTPVIGLEVHVELNTKSKMFCRCSAEYFGREPNTHTCPVCLGLPGALPVPNQKAIEWCIKIALALNCKINEFSKFDRKNYFYPDLAKGYQISQYDVPFGHDGSMKLSSGNTVRIRRVHMEEDTGKLTHASGASLIDFNRSGLPLVEIVTEPDFHDAKDVKEYLQKLQQIVRYLEVSNADMEKGDMRLEPNISLLRHPGEDSSSIGSLKKDSIAALQNDLPNYKVEVKNINSFRFVEKTIAFEIARQTQLLEEGKTPAQETRGWNETKQQTVSQRSKEDAQDFRYFPEPDIPTITTTQSQIAQLKTHMPELPDAKRERFIKEYNLSEYDAEILTRDKTLADYFEEAVTLSLKEKLTPKQIANEIINKKPDINTTSPQELVNQKKTLLINVSNTITVTEETIMDTVIKENQKAVDDYKNGKEPVIMFLVGQTMKKLGKKIDAQLVKDKLRQKLLK